MAAPTGIMALLAKPKGGGSKGPPAPAGDAGGKKEGGSEVGSALLEMFDALKAGDGEGAELAFRRAKEACDDSYESDESPDEESGSAEEDELGL
jgi:hypothetical protein